MVNPFRKRSKSAPGENKKNARNNQQLTGSPQIITDPTLAFSLPSENAFRTSLLMPKMADRFSLLRVDEPGQPRLAPVQQHESESEELRPPEHVFHHGHARDLSILEEGDEEDEELPVHPWTRHEARIRNEQALQDGMSKDEFIRVRAQEGNSLFSGKQRTFKIKSEDGNDTDRQYSSSSMSSKSPQSPAFEYRPSSSHTSSTSSILFATGKPPPINAKSTHVLGFDFGLAESKNSQVPPSPTSTVYEIIDSPTLPDFLLAEDGSATVDLVRNHLRRLSAGHPDPTRDLVERKISNDSSRGKIDASQKFEDPERDSLFWDDSTGVFGYYGSYDEADPDEQLSKSIIADLNAAKRSSPSSPKTQRQSLFDSLPPIKPQLNVATNVTVLRSPSPATPNKSPLRARGYSNTTSITSPIRSTHSSDTNTFPPVDVGHGYEAPLKDHQDNPARQDELRPLPRKSSLRGPSPEGTNRSRSNSTVGTTRSRSNSTVTGRNPVVIPPITTDPRYITPEMPSSAVFPHTPPPSVSPSQNGFTVHQVPPVSVIPDQSLTPPPTTNDRKAPTENVIKALQNKNISEPQFISMTAAIPTIPIIRMGDDKLEQLRNERRKATRATGKTPSLRNKPRKPMLEDETDTIDTANEITIRPTSPGPFTRRKASPPGIATRTLSRRRRETTAGSVLFDEELRERAPSPNSNLVAGPEYTTQLPSPHMMEDTPYQYVTQQKPRHRRKVSRQDIDPATTLSSPPGMNQWDGHPKRRMEGAIDPAW